MDIAPESGPPGDRDLEPASLGTTRAPASGGVPATPRPSRGLRMGLGVSLAALAAFVALALQVFHGEAPVLDQYLQARVAEWRSPHLTGYLLAVSLLADWRLILAAVAIAYVTCAARHASTRDLDLTAALLLVTCLINTSLKGWFQRPRPRLPLPLVEEPFYSFPSGHSITVFCLYGFLAYLAGTRLQRPGQRIAAWCACGSVTLLVGFSRIYLGAHFPCDVLAGYLVGVPVLAAAIVLHRSYASSLADADGRKESQAG